MRKTFQVVQAELTQTNVNLCRSRGGADAQLYRLRLDERWAYCQPWDFAGKPSAHRETLRALAAGPRVTAGLIQEGGGRWRLAWLLDESGLCLPAGGGVRSAAGAWSVMALAVGLLAFMAWALIGQAWLDGIGGWAMLVIAFAACLALVCVLALILAYPAAARGLSPARWAAHRAYQRARRMRAGGGA